MSKSLDFSGRMFYKKQLNASTYLVRFVIIVLREINQNNLNERDYYGVVL